MQLSVMREEARKIFNETDVNNTHISEAELTFWANECSRFLMTRLGVIPIKERDYASAANPVIALNARMVTINEVYMKIQPENKFVPLDIIHQDLLASMDPSWLSAETGIPSFFVRKGTFEARLYPPPNTANEGQIVRAYGLEFPADMAVDADLPDLPMNMHDLYPHYMAHKAFAKLQNHPKSTEELIFVNSGLKAQKNISVEFSSARRQWRWTESDEE